MGSVNQEITPLQTLPLYNLGTDEISNYISFPPPNILLRKIKNMTLRKYKT